jgi:hypothetical protein
MLLQTRNTVRIKEIENSKKNWYRKLKGRDYLEDLGVDGRKQ